MNKTVKNSLIIIAIVAILFGISWLVYDMFKKEPADVDANANLIDGNTGLDNMINELFENNIDNELVENHLDNKSNTMIENTQKQEDNKEEENVEEASSGAESVTTREERAVALVKKEWGSTDGVYFTSESIDSKGRYIVSVRDKKTTASLMFYVVDVDKKLVTEQ